MVLPGVFSAAELDTGTELLLSTIDNKIKGKSARSWLWRWGNWLLYDKKKRAPNAQITMTDIHAMALESRVKHFLKINYKARFTPVMSFLDIEGKFDLIISNPPFHDGIDTAYRTVKELITHKMASQSMWRNYGCRHAFCLIPEF